MVSIILSLLMLVGGVAESYATTYYVATTGSNSNNGTSESTPYLTIQKCVDMMVAGDTCNVGGGTYSATGVRFRVSGSPGSPITLQAQAGATPILSCTGTSLESNSFFLMNGTSYKQPIGWINITGFEITNCHDSIKWYNLHDAIISNMYLHHNINQGVLGVGTYNVIFQRSIVAQNGPLGASTSNLEHGLYIGGTNVVVRNNLIYGNQAYGVQIDGNKSYTVGGSYASSEYARSDNWIVESNTITHQSARGAIVVWGPNADGARIENNIFYENNVQNLVGNAQGVSYQSATGSTGVLIRNNHAYGTGATAFTTGTAPPDVTLSGNVINVSPPAFVNGGTNSLPASPDFRLTARAPVNIALANEFTSNGVVGAFQPPDTPTAAITTNKITVVLPLSTAVPVQNLSTTGVTFSCTANVCPGSPVVSSVSRVTGADNTVEITLSGITSDACLVHADAVTVSYSSSTGSWTANDNIGPYPGLHQKILSFTSVAVTNNCTGSGPSGGTASYINYPMENGSGTTVSDTSGNGLHGTTSGTWVSGHTGYGITVAGGTTQQTTIPYGSGVNPSTQSMTWVVPVYVPTGQTGVIRYLFGPELGTNQRGYIGANSGTWRVGRQSTSISSAGASNLAVTEGWNHLCARWDSGTDTVTLYKNGVAGTGGATGSYTSFSFATNIEFPMIGTNLHTTVPEATFDDVQVFTALEDCATLYAAWNAPPSTAGTIAQSAIQFQGVILDTAGNPIVIGPSVQSIEVPAGGGVVLLFQVHCTNVADCDLTAFKLVYAKNGSGVWQQVPDVETADGTWMWGVTTDANLNSGTRSTRLTGSCAVTTGSTQITSAQTPSVDLPQDGCTILAYIIREGTAQAGNYFDYKLRTEANVDFTTYTQTARVRVVNPMASGIGF